MLSRHSQGKVGRFPKSRKPGGTQRMKKGLCLKGGEIKNGIKRKCFPIKDGRHTGEKTSGKEKLLVTKSEKFKRGPSGRGEKTEGPKGEGGRPKRKR